MAAECRGLAGRAPALRGPQMDVQMWEPWCSQRLFLAPSSCRRWVCHARVEGRPRVEDVLARRLCRLELPKPIPTAGARSGKRRPTLWF